MMVKTILKASKDSFEWLVESLFPEKCLVCRKEGFYLCRKHYVFLPAPRNEVCFEYLDDIYAATAYYHPTSEVVVEYFKFKGFKQVGKIMAYEMEKFLSNSTFEDAVFVPIPLHWTRWWWRGFNQSAVLLNYLKTLQPRLVIAEGLKRSKRTSQQARLDKEARKKNMEEAFRWEGGGSVPKKIILIDDVVASGATLDMAAKELKRIGVKEVYAVVFARGGGER